MGSAALSARVAEVEDALANDSLLVGGSAVAFRAAVGSCFARALSAYAPCARHLETEALHQFRLREELARCAVERRASVIEHENAVGREGVFHKVGYMQDGDAAGAELGDDASHARAALGIEHGAWLVEQQDFRFHCERPGNRHALHLPAG